MASVVAQHPLFRSPLEEDLKYRPVDMLLADHYRQRLLAADLLGLCNNLGDPDVQGDAGLIRANLSLALRQHEIFEEQDLAPLLKRRCKPTDCIDKIFAILLWIHFIDHDNAATLDAGLLSLSKGFMPRDRDAFLGCAHGFAEKIIQHVLWENRVIIPLARRRLNSTDLQELGEKAAERHRLSLWPSMQVFSDIDMFSVARWPN